MDARDADLRARLVTFYQIHNPANAGNVDLIVNKFRGKEAKLWETMAEKYDA